MKSINQTIHYGVPAICIPINDDQPLVAYRVRHLNSQINTSNSKLYINMNLFLLKLADELGLGIRLDNADIKSTQIRTAIHKIFDDVNYYERARRHSIFSRKYSGQAAGIKIIMKCLEKYN
jgi:UDP:flavonoid glycosyltransferase YjiC (YdhE family)